MIGDAATTSLPWAYLILAGIGIVTGLYGGVKWVRKQLRDGAVRDLQPVIELAIKQALAPIIAELHPNGGSSLRDSVDRLEQEMARAEEWRAAADIQLRNIQQAQTKDVTGVRRMYE